MRDLAETGVRIVAAPMSSLVFTHPRLHVRALLRATDVIDGALERRKTEWFSPSVDCLRYPPISMPSCPWPVASAITAGRGPSRHRRVDMHCPCQATRRRSPHPFRSWPIPEPWPDRCAGPTTSCPSSDSQSSSIAVINGSSSTIRIFAIPTPVAGQVEFIDNRPVAQGGKALQTREIFIVSFAIPRALSLQSAQQIGRWPRSVVFPMPWHTRACQPPPIRPRRL